MKQKAFARSPVITTGRLVLRELSRQDLDVIFFLRSDPDVNKYIKREPARSIADAEAWLESIFKRIEEQKSFNWAITLSGEGKMIGSVCLWNFSPDRLVAELGYDLHPHFHGKGIMSEAVDAVLEFGFRGLGLHTIEAFTSKYNEASIKMLEKKEFILKKNEKDDGNPDNVIYKKTRNQAISR